MNKKILITVLAIALTVGIASAAFISYFGQVKMTVTVGQSVLLDGKDYTQMPIEEAAAVGGGETFCKPHYLESQASVPVDLHFVTTFSPALTDTEIVVTYSTEIIDGNTNFGSTDNELVAFPITSGLTLNDLFAGGGFSYAYTIIDGGAFDGASPVIAVIDLDDGRHVILYPGWGARTGAHTLTFSDTVASDTGGNNLVDFTIYASDFAGGAQWSSNSEYGNWNYLKASGSSTGGALPLTGTEVVTRIAIQHQAANTGEIDRLDSLTFNGQTYEFDIVECTPFTLEPGQKLHFVICYSFDPLIQPDTYIIYSTVEPAP